MWYQTFLIQVRSGSDPDPVTDHYRTFCKLFSNILMIVVDMLQSLTTSLYLLVLFLAVCVCVCDLLRRRGRRQLRRCSQEWRPGGSNPWLVRSIRSTKLLKPTRTSSTAPGLLGKWSWLYESYKNLTLIEGVLFLVKFAWTRGLFCDITTVFDPQKPLRSLILAS